LLPHILILIMGETISQDKERHCCLLVHNTSDTPFTICYVAFRVNLCEYHNVQNFLGTEYLRVPSASFLLNKVKQSDRDADHSPPSTAKVQNEWSSTFTSPLIPLWRALKQIYLHECYGLNGSNFDLVQGQEVFLFLSATRPAARAKKPLIKWTLGFPAPGIRRPGRQTDYSPSGADVRTECRCTSGLPHTSQWRARNNFSFYVYLQAVLRLKNAYFTKQY
jgi:hypothetical protein